VERLFIAETNRRAVGPVKGLAVLFAGVIAMITVFDAAVRSPVAGELLRGRLLGIAGALAGAWATRFPFVVRWGQPILAGFFVLLHIGIYTSVAAYPDHVLASVPAFLMAMAMTLVLPALLFRFAAPIAALATFGYAERMVAFMPGVSFTVPIFFLVATLAVLAFGAYASERGRRTAWAASRALAREKARSEALLLNVLPPSIAGRMSRGERLIADNHETATILFADIVGFTPLSRTMDPNTLVALLDRVFTAFDAIADEYDLEKIKTIGDSYMLAAGAPAERMGEPERVCRAALAMRQALAEIARGIDASLSMRIGIHIGPVVAGVIGQKKFIYDIWGDTVNTASRMESSAPPGEIQVTAAVVQHLEGRLPFTRRGEIEVKGLGPMEVFLLDADAA